MFNLRYHIASLVAVFLSLALGLLLGTIIVERGVLDTQQTALVDGLRSEFTRLADEIEELRDQNEAHAEFLGEVVPVLVEGSLEATPVLIITNAGRSDGLSTLAGDIRMAGGEPVVLVLGSPSFGLDDSALAERVAAMLSSDESNLSPDDVDLLVESLAESLTAEWTAPQAARPLTELLIEEGVLSADDLSAVMAVRALAVVAAWDSEPDAAGIALANAFQQAGVPALGVELPGSENGIAAAFAAEGLSAIDHLTTPEGAYSLVRVLAGTASGAYGYSSTATRAFPDVVLPTP